jgi:hypothetical protein
VTGNTYLWASYFLKTTFMLEHFLINQNACLDLNCYKANLATKDLISGMVLSKRSLVPFHRFVSCNG